MVDEIPIRPGQSVTVSAGGAVRLVLQPAAVDLLEFGDLNFRHDRSVLVPPLTEEEIQKTSGKPPPSQGSASSEPEPPQPIDRSLTANAALAAAFEFARDHAFDGRPRASQPAKRVCVAGHTDQSGSASYNDTLSLERARSVAFFMRADGREDWAAHSFQRAEDDDWQQVLTWVHLTRGYYCNPRGIDNDFGSRSERALRNFRIAFNADTRGELEVEGPRRVEDWLAFHALYEDALALSMGATAAAVRELRHLFVFTDPPVLGCGERFPLGDPDNPTRPPELYSPRDRRVDIVFFDAHEVPDLAADPPGQALYGEGRFILRGLRASPEPERPPRPVVERLQVSDANFDTGHAILMPSTVPGIDAPGIVASFTFKKLFEVVAQKPAKQILVTGHTDTEGSDAANDALSAERAQSVLLYLAGLVNRWAAHAFAHQKAKDYQRVLTWVAMHKKGLAGPPDERLQADDADDGEGADADFVPYDCDPGGIDGDFGTNSKAALENFKRSFNREFPEFALTVDRERREEDWQAFFLLYDQALAEGLGIDVATLQERRRDLRFTQPAAMGCGERWPIDAIGQDEHDNAHNRRVDILLFDEDEVPELMALPPGLLVYGIGRFELRTISQKIRVPLLDVGDTSFRTARSVLMPEPVGEQAEAAPAPESLTLDRMLERLFDALERFPDKRVLVAGHADSVGSDADNRELSARRAESVLFYLAPDMKENWVDHAQANHAAEDYQQVLTWAAQQKPYGCDPGGIDNDFGSGSKRALQAFKVGFNAELGTALPEDGERRREDWGAFYDLYDDVLSRQLELEGDFAERQAALNERRQRLLFTEPAAIGCGEDFTVERAGVDAVPSQRNRRVDVLLFDEGEAPPLDTDPPGQAIYGMGRFQMLPLEAQQAPVAIAFFGRPAEHDERSEEPHSLVVPAGSEVVLHWRALAADAAQLFRHELTTSAEVPLSGGGRLLQFEDGGEGSTRLSVESDAVFQLTLLNVSGETEVFRAVYVTVDEPSLPGGQLFVGQDFMILGEPEEDAT